MPPNDDFFMTNKFNSKSTMDDNDFDCVFNSDTIKSNNNSS